MVRMNPHRSTARSVLTASLEITKEKLCMQSLIGRRGPLGALDSSVNENRGARLFRLPCFFRRFSGGSDETRTRDLRRDRATVHQVNTMLS